MTSIALFNHLKHAHVTSIKQGLPHGEHPVLAIIHLLYIYNIEGEDSPAEKYSQLYIKLYTILTQNMILL